MEKKCQIERQYLKVFKKILVIFLIHQILKQILYVTKATIQLCEESLNKTYKKVDENNFIEEM